MPKLVIWGSPHINALGASKNDKQLDCPTNGEFKEKAFDWLVQQFPSSEVVCPIPAKKADCQMLWIYAARVFRRWLPAIRADGISRRAFARFVHLPTCPGVEVS